MENTLDWGMDWILTLQEFGGPLLKPFLEIVTFTGEEMFYLLFVPLLFWAIDPRMGTRVGFAFLITAYVNPILKDLFPEPRPYQINPQVSDIEVPGSGMPSGHAQSSVFVWGVLAAQIGRRWFWAAAVFFMFLVGFSRVYLGVHFPHQVIAGWAVGAVLLTLFLVIDPRLEPWLGGLTLSRQLAVSIIVPLVLVLLYPHNDTAASAAVMCGFGSGMAISIKLGQLPIGGVWWRRLVRSAIGLAGLLILYLGLSAVFPGEEDVSTTIYFAFRFLRYAVLGLWISLGAPWLFAILHLIDQPESAGKPEGALG